MEFNLPKRTDNTRDVSGWRAAVMIAVIYILVAGLWILLSDRVLLMFIVNADDLTWLQTVKGWVFVLATALLLAWLVRRDVKALQVEIKVCNNVQERFRALVETIPHGIQECDCHGKITFTNTGFDRIFGYDRGEAIGKSAWDNAAGSEEAVWHRKHVSNLVTQQPEPTPFVTRKRTRDGQVLDVQVDWGYLRSEKGGLTGFASIITDITERQKAEEAIRTSDRLKSELIGTAAHEFRTPLTTIQGYAELLLGDFQFSEAEKNEYLDIIHRKSVNMSDMVDSLLDLSRIEAGQPLPMKFESFEIAEIVKEVTPLLNALSAQFRLEMDLSGGERLVQADRGKIGQVLENLLSNAAKYSERGSEISLRGKPLDSAYRFEVVDQGIGMTAEHVEKIFDRFYRVDMSDTSPAGLGIGMAIVKVIVEAHGSEVRIASTPGEGTRVSFDLPFSQSSVADAV